MVGVLREGNFVKITKLEMAELQGQSFGLKMESVAPERIARKTEAKKVEIAAEITRWETAALQQGSVAEKKGEKFVDVSAGIAENKSIAGLDPKLAAVELYVFLVAERTVAAGKWRTDVDGNW